MQLQPHTAVIDSTDQGSRPPTSSVTPADQRATEGVASAEDVLECLYEAHAPAIFAWIQGMLGSREVAEDSVQTIWLNLAKKPDRLVRVSNLRAYIWSATRNHVNSLLRRRSLERLWMRPLETDDLEHLLVPDSPGSVSAAEVTDLARAVQALSHKLRAVVLLVSFEGFTLEEAAESLGIPRGTAASRFHSAIKKMKVDLAKKEPT